MSEQPSIDWQQTRHVLGLLLEAIRGRVYPYQNFEDSLPQNLIPPEIRANRGECARILFYSCHYMRGTIKSEHAMRCMVRLYGRRPDMFDPYAASLMSHEAVAYELKYVLPYKIEEISRFWIENSKRLVEHWQGDPLKVFEETLVPDDVYRFFANRDTTKGVAKGPDAREDGFLGFQKKMSSLAVYFFVAMRLIMGEVTEKISSPIDYHNVRIFYSTGMIRAPGHWTSARYEQLQPLGIELIEEYLRTSNATMQELCDAVWLLSVLLCSRSPATYTSKGKWSPIDWESESTFRKYQATCGACPLQEECHLAIPAYAYYEWGYFDLSHPRERPPVEHRALPFEELPHIMPKRLPRRKSLQKPSFQDVHPTFDFMSSATIRKD